MTTHERGTETVPLGGEVGGDEGEDIQWDAVDGNEGVLPLAYGCQCGRSILVELRNRIRSEAVGKLEIGSSESPGSQLTQENMPRASTPR